MAPGAIFLPSPRGLPLDAPRKGGERRFRAGWGDGMTLRLHPAFRFIFGFWMAFERRGGPVGVVARRRADLVRPCASGAGAPSALAAGEARVRAKRAQSADPVPRCASAARRVAESAGASGRSPPPPPDRMSDRRERMERGGSPPGARERVGSPGAAKSESPHSRPAPPSPKRAGF